MLHHEIEAELQSSEFNTTWTLDICLNVCNIFFICDHFNSFRWVFGQISNLLRNLSYNLRGKVFNIGTLQGKRYFWCLDHSFYELKHSLRCKKTPFFMIKKKKVSTMLKERKTSTKFVEIIHSRYFHKHFDHIQHGNLKSRVYVCNRIYSKLDCGFPVLKNRWIILSFPALSNLFPRTFVVQNVVFYPSEKSGWTS